MNDEALDIPAIHLPMGTLMFGADYGPSLGPRVVIFAGPLSLAIPADDRIDQLCNYLKLAKMQAIRAERALKQGALDFHNPSRKEG